MILWEILILGADCKDCVAIGVFTEVKEIVNDFNNWIWKGYGKSNGLGMTGCMDADDGSVIMSITGHSTYEMFDWEFSR